MDKARVSRITIGRLYNLGSYEHVRYEIAVDIGAGDDATKVLGNVEGILAALKPDRDGMGVYDRQRLKEYEEKESNRHLTDHESAQLELLRAKESKRKAAAELREKARAALNDIGGTYVYKDAKLDWDDEYF